MPNIIGQFKGKLKKRISSLDIFKLLSSKKEDAAKNDPDEKWSNLYRERQKNHLYKWVGVNKGGELLQVYETEGEEGIVRFANEKIAPLLYNDGTNLKMIHLADYLKWKKSVDTSLAGGDSATGDQLEEMSAKFLDHKAQWKLNKRGVDGETVVHLLLSRDEAKCTEIVKLLLKVFPGMAVDIYEGDEFYGQSALHLAIVHGDFDCVNSLVEAGASVKCRATGRFFLPEDQKGRRKAKQTDYYGFAYFGEYPLAFAASFGNKDIYDYLIQRGAEPNAQDSFGNTVSHICVINNSIEMYSYAVRHWAKPADVNICNYAGYTPLTLATIMGRREIFEAMLELTKVEFWRFSDMACSAYPLTTLDTIRTDGSTNWESALMRVVSGSTADHLDIVGTDVIQRLLADKWRSFGHRKMYQRMILLILHLIVLSAAIYIRPEKAEYLWGRHGASDIFRYVVEGFVMFSCSAFLFYQQGSEIKAQGLRGYLRTLIRAPDKIMFLISNVLLLACVPCRLTDQHTLEETFVALALPGSWIYLLFFAKGYLLTGPFVIMIYSMIGGDMVRFAVISLIFLVSFSQAFYFLGKDIKERQRVGNMCSVTLDDHMIVDYDAYLETALTLFRMALGGYEYEYFDCASYKGFVKILFVIYMIIMPIMLINMLIAMMGNTYTSIISQAEKAWRQQWAELVILLERGLDKKKLAKYQAAYSIKLSDDRFDPDDAMEVRALMVIKQTKKTRAKQRKQAVALWKRLTRKVLSLIRTFGAEHTKMTLHSHTAAPYSTSFSRPTSSISVRDGRVSRVPSRMLLPRSMEGGASISGHSIIISDAVDKPGVSSVPRSQAEQLPLVDRHSPLLLVHQADTVSMRDGLTEVGRCANKNNHLSVDYSIDAPTFPSVLPAETATLTASASTNTMELHSVDSVPTVSSPSSPYSGQPPAQQVQHQPPPVQLDVERLAHILPRPVSLASRTYAAKHRFKRSVGKWTGSQPNVPPAHLRRRPGDSETIAKDDKRVEPRSPFLPDQTSDYLPNIPLHDLDATRSEDKNVIEIAADQEDTTHAAVRNPIPSRSDRKGMKSQRL